MEKPIEPTHSELFNGHLKRLTNYEQRVKYGIGDDIKDRHKDLAQQPLEGLKSRAIPLMSEKKKNPTLFPKVDPFDEEKGSFTIEMEQEKE